MHCHTERSEVSIAAQLQDPSHPVTRYAHREPLFNVFIKVWSG